MRAMISGEIEQLIKAEAAKRGVHPNTMHRFILTEWAMTFTLERTKRGRGRPPLALPAKEVTG